MFLTNLYKDFAIPEASGKKIGIFRIVSSIFGGFIVSYLALVVLALLIPIPNEESLILSLYIGSFVWACNILWIALASSKLIVLLRIFVPTITFLVLIFIKGY